MTIQYIFCIAAEAETLKISPGVSCTPVFQTNIRYKIRITRFLKTVVGWGLREDPAVKFKGLEMFWTLKNESIVFMTNVMNGSNAVRMHMASRLHL